MEFEQAYDYEFKILLLGDTCGKTKLLQRFIQDKYDPKYNPTIGDTISEKIISFSNRKAHLEIWDMPGQERYRDMN